MDCRLAISAISQFSVLMGQKVQLTGSHNGNEMHDVIYMAEQTSVEWPHCHSPYCASGLIEVCPQCRGVYSCIFVLPDNFLSKKRIYE